MEEAQIKQIIERQPLHGSALLDPRCKILLLVSIGFVCYFLAYYGLLGSVLFHSILVTNFARIEKILDRRGRFLYLVVFVLYYVQITVNAGYNEPLIEVLFLLVPALLVLNTERCCTRTAATGDSQYIRSRAVQ